MRKQIPNESLQKQLVPNYSLGCKRVLFHDTYYPTLTLPHVHVHSEKIVKVDNNKIVLADGSSRNLDVSASCVFTVRFRCET